MKQRFLFVFVLLLASPLLFASEPRIDPRQWMIELEGEPAVESWLKAGVAGRTSAMSASVSRISQLESAQLRLEELLVAPEIGARVQYRTQRLFNGIAVFVDPARVDAIRALPGVKSVKPLVLHSLANATSVPFLGVPTQVWQAYGNAGEGIKVGIIDTGIDYQHADFGGNGVEADYRANDRTKAPDAYFPTARVVGGYDFAGDDYGSGGAARPDPDPMDCAGHGSHVAGTVGGSGVRSDGTTFPGPYDDSVPFASLRIGPGVAPKASLYALRVFGCSGSTGLVTQALEWAIDPNRDGDFSDRLDVVNLSLGSEFGESTDSSAIASDNAARAGLVVVCSAGNSGDTYFVTGSPGTSDYAISVAASADSGVTAGALRVLQPASVAGVVGAGTAIFGGVPQAAGTTGPLVQAVPADACATITNGSALSGKIALIDRGTCTFVEKVKRAQDAGALAVVIANNAEGTLSMGGSDATVTIPSVLVSLTSANRLKSELAGGVVVALFPGSDTLASFSSRGPRRENVPAGPKPDVAAPGVSITSVQSGVTSSSSTIQFTGGSPAATMSGTSMAAPHLAGVMALVRKAHPGWTPAELKAAVMNTAGFDVGEYPPAGSLPVYGPARVGAGRVDAARAIATNVLAFNDERPELVSLGAFVEGTVPVTAARKIRIVNKGATPVTLRPGWAAASTIPGVGVEVPAAPIVVPGGGVTTFDVKVALVDPTVVTHAPDPTLELSQPSFVPIANRFWMAEAGGVVTLAGAPAGTLRVPLHVVVRGQSDLKAASHALGVPVSGGAFAIPLVGTGLKTGPLLPIDVVSTVSAFELNAESPKIAGANAARAAADLAWVGAASSVPVTGFGADATVWFAVATWGEWVSPSESSFVIDVDRNGDGIADARVRTLQTGEVEDPASPGETGSPTDVHVSFTSTNGPAFDVGTYRYLNGDPAARDTNLFASNVVVIAAPAGSTGLGLSAGNARFRYRISSSSTDVGNVDDTPWLTFDAEKPGYSVLAANGAPFHDDLGGTALPARYDAASAQATGALGVLLLHHHNAFAARAEPLTGRNSPPSVSIAEPATGGTFDAGFGIRFRAVGSDPDAGEALTYAWDLGDGRSATGADVTVSYGRAGTYPASVTVTDGAGATATALVSLTVREPQNVSGVSRLLPVVLDVQGVGGAHFTTEVTLVSRASAPSRALLRYTASAGSGSGWAGLDLAAGETRVLPDVIETLRSQGLSIPDDGSNQVGTLGVTLVGATNAADLFVGARTSTPGDGGSFGLFYSDAALTSSTAIVAGLQQSSAMRSNLAIVNGGPDPVVLRVRLEGPNGEDLGVLADWTLAAWGWKQFDRPLEGKATSGRAVVTRLSGTSPFSAYGVLNDSGTSDGSFVPPYFQGPGPVPGTPVERMIPVALDVKGRGVNRYVTELTLANLGGGPVDVLLVYRATATFGGGSGSVPLTLAAGEQRVLPDAMAFLRTGGLAIPSDGTNVAGSLLVRASSPASAGVALVAGARVSTKASGRDGSFGVFYPGLTLFESADGAAWVHGLQQNAAMRSNVALVNFGDAGSVTLRVTFLGAAGQTLASPEEHSLAAGEWRQLNEPLSTRGAAVGSAKVERISGTSRFIAYGVLNDAATSDGSYLPMAR